MVLRLSQGTSLVFVDGQPLIFSSGRQALLSVNQIGGYVSCRLEEGVCFDQLSRELADRGVRRSGPMLRDVLANWSTQGLVSACDPDPRAPPVRVQTIAIGAVSLSLSYHDEALARMVAPLFDHLQRDSLSCAIGYALWEANGMAFLSRNDEPACLMQPSQAGPVLKAKITEEILKDPRWRLALHAGCLHRRGKALLLLGEPGAGKTTLTSWLTAQGFDYAGDDIAMVDGEGRVQGLAFLPSVKAGAWPLLESVYGDMARLPVHLRADRKRVRFPTPGGIAAEQPVGIGWIIRLRRRSAGGAELRPMTTAIALRQLLAEAASHDEEIGRDSLDLMIRTVAAARCHELHYARLDDATALLKQICDDEPA
ncbi:hypothetical protein [Sphingobium bisphenolivorans]|uniref:hypothetical protein n=1 Tax=Sphingobium bisphenolivorans TaxID=1335760 RepID=UPI0003A94792|nr:hypothetical protein [Sphingobium bisphenolivorans]